MDYYTEHKTIGAAVNLLFGATSYPNSRCFNKADQNCFLVNLLEVEMGNWRRAAIDGVVGAGNRNFTTEHFIFINELDQKT